MNFNGLKSSEVEVSRTTYGSNKLPEPELKNGIILLRRH